MAWETPTIIFFGFGLYTLGLVLRSSSIRRLHFSNFIDAAQLTNLPPRMRSVLSATSVTASISLFGWVVRRSIDKDYSSLYILFGLGVLLVSVRTFCFFCPKISFLGFEIESETDLKPNLHHVTHSPFILGGLLLTFLSLATPVAFTALLNWGYDRYEKVQFERLEAQARRERFKERYQPRRLFYAGTTSGQVGGYLPEETFFETLENQRGKRFVLTGRAGIGKSWFLMKIRYRYHSRDKGKRIIHLEAQDFSGTDTLYAQINRKIYGDISWFSLPVAHRIINDPSTIILLDAFDEVSPLNREDVAKKITEFSNSYRDNAIVLTTRPTGRNWQEFEKLSLPELNATEVEDAILQSRDVLVDAILEEIRKGMQINHEFLRLLAPAEIEITGKDFSSPEVLADFYKPFLDKFGFSRKEGELPGNMPSLRTYRDLDNARETFLDATFNQFTLSKENLAEARREVFRHYLLKRLAKNYKHASSEAIITKMCDLCQKQLRATPNLKTFRMTKELLSGRFGDKAILAQILVESELMFEDKGSFRFDNSSVDTFFMECSPQ